MVNQKILYIKDLLQEDVPAEGKSSLGDEDVPAAEDIEPSMDEHVCCLL